MEMKKNILVNDGLLGSLSTADVFANLVNQRFRLERFGDVVRATSHRCPQPFYNTAILRKQNDGNALRSLVFLHQP